MCSCIEALQWNSFTFGGTDYDNDQIQPAHEQVALIKFKLAMCKKFARLKKNVVKLTWNLIWKMPQNNEWGSG